MLYEKKLIILSGSGKGVVLVERSAKGVKFSLRTFDMAVKVSLRVGVITPERVFVRDLPERQNPSLVFYVDDMPIDKIHFAVFDSEIVLYGATCQRMWESNVLSLVTAAEKKSKILPSITRMPPQAAITPPQTAPSISADYRDDTLAAADFYTTLDFTSRMTEVESFLDGKRILNGLSPTVTPSVNSEVGADVYPQTLSTTQIEHCDNIKDNCADLVETSIDVGVVTDDCSQAKPNAFVFDENDNKSSSRSEKCIIKEQVTCGDNENAKCQSVNSGENAMQDDDCDISVAPQNLTEKKGEGEYKGQSTAEQAVTDYDNSKQPLSINDIVRSEKYTPAALQARYMSSLSKRKIKPEEVAFVPPIAEVAAVKRIESRTALDKKDIELLFSAGERDVELATLLPELEFVKVNIEGGTVSVGKTRDGAFLCYAVAASYEKQSPLGKEAQWLPRLKTAPCGKGYWLIFQNVSTGEVINPLS